jgi:MFS family permease
LAEQLGATWRVLRAVLRSPALRRVMVAFLLFAAVEYGSWVAILLWAYDVIGPESVGVVAVVQLLPSAAFAAVATSFADRYARQHVLLASYALQAVALAVTAAAMLLAWPAGIVLAAAIAAAFGITITRPAHWALLPMLARTPEELTTANGVAGSVEGVGRMMGPLAAALVLLAGTPGTVVGVSALAAAVAVALVVRLPVHGGGRVVHAHATDDAEAGWELASPAVPAGDSERRAAGRVSAAIHAIAGTRDVRVIVLVVAACAFVVGATDVLFVLFALGVLDVGGPGAGALSAALGLGWVLGGIGAFTLVGRRRLAPVLLIGAALVGLSCLVLGIAATFALALLVIVVAGAGAAALDIAGRTLLQRVADPRALTRALGVLEGVCLAATAGGALLAPIIASATSVPVALAVTGLVLPAAVGVAWLPLQDIDRRVRVPVRELALLRRNRILSPLPGPKLEAVASGGRWITLEPREVLIREGDPGDRYYVLESGSLRITQQERVLHEAETDRGYGLGEIALLRDIPRTATATANEPSVLLAIARPDFLEAVTGHEQAGAAAQQTADTREPAPDAA